MYLTMHYHLKLYLIEISLTDLIFNLPQLNQSLIKLLLMQTEQLKLRKFNSRRNVLTYHILEEVYTITMEKVS